MELQEKLMLPCPVEMALIIFLIQSGVKNVLWGKDETVFPFLAFSKGKKTVLEKVVESTV